MFVDRDSPIPIYFQLMRHFKQLIEIGELAPGDRLPTESELCERHHISRAPVRRALTDLAREGFVYRRPGQGTFVTDSLPDTATQHTEIHILAHYDIRWLESVEQAVYQWNTLHPEQEVKLKPTLCSRAEFHHVLQRAVAQGRAPDIAPMDCVWITSYALSGYITPLSRIDAEWVAEVSADLEPLVQQSNSVGGELYGLPVQTDITGLWYRRDWFAAEQLTPPDTWEVWLDLIDYFARPEVKGRFGHHHSVAFPLSTSVGEATLNNLLPFIWMSGGDICVEGSAARVDNPPVHAALRFLQRITLERRASLPPQMDTFRWWDFTSLLAQGAAPMILGGTYEWPRIQEETDWDDEAATHAHLGFVPVPRPTADSAPACSLGGTSWAILEQSRNRELALEILKLAASPELSRNFCEENLQISPRRSVNRRLSEATHPWLSTVIPLLQWAHLRPALKNYNHVSRFLQEMLEQVLWYGAPLEVVVQRTDQLLALLLADAA